MHRMILVMVALFVGVILCGASLVAAQGQPGGPVAQQPQTGGRQQPPPGIPPEQLNAPYHGASTHLPPGVNIPIPRNQDEARQIEAQYRPQLQQAAEAARAAAAAERRMAERVRRGDRSLPTAAERGLGTSYSPTQQRTLPPRRGSTPIEQAMHLLDVSGSGTPPEAQPDAAPDADPSEQSVQNACAVYALLYLDHDPAEHADILWAQTLNICAYIELYRIDRLEVNQHLYRCSWYFTAFDFCLAPVYFLSFLPYCELYGAHQYLWCGPQGWYPPDAAAGYFVRSWGNIWTIEGLFGTASDDSTNLGYRCDEHRYDASCS